MNRAQAEAQQLFDDAVRAHGAAIGRVAAAFERDPALREDLMQDILLALWQALPQWRGDAPVQHFVLRIAHNRAATHALKAARQPRSAELDVAIPDSRPSIEHHAIQAQAADHLLLAIRQLSVSDRQIVTLALEGLTYQQIAALLEIKPNAAGVRLNRARGRLKALMEPGAQPEREVRHG